ncbi:MAG: acyl-CoA thioesterase [Sphingomonadales bacterium]|nr:acyl-CoA thioesterase [Sphingomonadales bacterium]
MTSHRDPVIRTAPQPSDINIKGHIFGGWVLSQMDIAGGVTAARTAKGQVATVAVEGMKFLTPVLVGDLISCYTKVTKIGKTSMHIHIDVMANRPGMEEEIKVTEGVYIFVAVDEDGRPRQVKQT